MIDGQSAFSAFRIKKETIRTLQDLKRAYEISYAKEMTNDELIKKMIASIEDGDPAVWELYCIQQTQLEVLKAKARESQKAREGKD